jgi:peptidoglycan/LPS O-acetylase OafA/YrhL
VKHQQPPMAEPDGPLGNKAWIVASAGFSAVQAFDWPSMPMAETGWRYTAASVGGLAIGALWQVLGRRDLADRLLVVALLMIPSAFVFLVDSGNYTPATAQACLCIVAGLVLAEQGWRWHDRRAEREREIDAILNGDELG